jgi:Holliday junction DNA helicase RuvA
MLSLVAGTLVSRELDRAEVMTAGGVGYELAIPLGTFEALPRAGEKVTLHTHLVVREDEWQLYGFATPFERRVFQRLLGATGVGPALALGMLSTLSPERVVRALKEKDLATLQQVPRVGRKKAEQMILDLSEKLADLIAGGGGAGRPDGAGADDAIRALVALGYSTSDAEKGVRHALDAATPGASAPELIRLALAHIARK